jgi:hypothetical protein
MDLAEAVFTRSSSFDHHPGWSGASAFRLHNQTKVCDPDRGTLVPEPTKLNQRNDVILSVAMAASSVMLFFGTGLHPL